MDAGPGHAVEAEVSVRTAVAVLLVGAALLSTAPATSAAAEEEAPQPVELRLKPLPDGVAGNIWPLGRDESRQHCGGGGLYLTLVIPVAVNRDRTSTPPL